MSWLMGLIYTGISWILLRWHDLFDWMLPDGRFLGTNWDWVLAIVFLVITIRIILFPIFVKQIRSQRAMQALQPRMKELQKKHEGDRQTLQQEMMKLYQTEKVNPLMGCLPMFLQIPVFLGLFHVLKSLNPADPRTRELYGWRADQWDSAVQARLFDAPLPAHFNSDAINLALLDASGAIVKTVALILVVIMMITTFLTSRQMILKTGWQADPQQRMIQKLMLYGIPVTLLFSGFFFPLGVIIYWVTQNIVSLGQQNWVLHKYPPPVSETPPTAKPRVAGVKQPNALVRFLTVQPSEPKPRGAANQGFLSRFRRRGPITATPVVDTRSSAPRPGAKPIVGAKPVGGPKPGTGAKPPIPAKASTKPENTVEPTPDVEVEVAESVPAPAANGKAVPVNGSAAKAVPAKAVPAKAAPAKAAPVKAAPTQPKAVVPAPANGQPTNGASPAGASTGGASSGQRTPAKKATPAKAGARKSPSSKKGGRRH